MHSQQFFLNCHHQISVTPLRIGVQVATHLNFPFVCLVLDLQIPQSSNTFSLSATKHGKFVYTFPVPQSYPAPQITWSKDDVQLSETNRIMFSDLGNLYIGNVQVDDIGGYRSVVRNTVTRQSYSRALVSLQSVAGASICCNFIDSHIGK